MSYGEDAGCVHPAAAVLASLAPTGALAWPSDIRVVPRPSHGIRRAFSRSPLLPSNRQYDFAPRALARDEAQRPDELSRYPFPRAHVPPLGMVAMFVADLRSWLAPPAPQDPDEPHHSATLYGPDHRSALMAICYLLTLPQLPSGSAPADAQDAPLDCSLTPSASPTSPITVNTLSTTRTSTSTEPPLPHGTSPLSRPIPLHEPAKPVDRLDGVLAFHEFHGPQLRPKPSFRERLSSFGTRSSSALKVHSIRTRCLSISSQMGAAERPRPYSVANGLLAVSPVAFHQRLAQSMDEVRQEPPTEFLSRRRKSQGDAPRPHSTPSGEDYMEVLSSPSARVSSNSLDPAASPVTSAASLSPCSRMPSTLPPVEPIMTNSSALSPYPTRMEGRLSSPASSLPPSHKRWARYWARTLTAAQDPRRTVRSVLPVAPRKVVVTAVRVELASAARAELTVQLGRYDDDVLGRMTQWERGARRNFQLYGDHHPGAEAYDLPLGGPRRPDIDATVMDREDAHVTAASERERHAELERLRASLRAKNSWGINVDAEAETVRRFNWSLSPAAQAPSTGKKDKGEMQVQFFATVPCFASSIMQSSVGQTGVYNASLGPAESGFAAEADRELCIKLSLGRAEGRKGPTCSSPRKTPAAQSCWAWIVPSFESSAPGPHTLRLDASEVDHAFPGLISVQVDWTCLAPSAQDDDDDIPTF